MYQQSVLFQINFMGFIKKNNKYQSANNYNRNYLDNLIF